MDGRIKLFDLVKSSIESEDDKIASFGMRIDEERLSILEDYCNEIDKISEDSDGIGFSCLVLENHMIQIGVEVEYISVVGKQCIFKDLIDRSVRFTIKYGADNESAIVTFVFPSVWRR